LTVGLTGEYRVTPWISVGIFYRLFTPFLTKFDVDYKNGISEKVQGFGGRIPSAPTAAGRKVTARRNPSRANIEIACLVSPFSF